MKQARVSYSVERLINLGNYEKVKVQEGLEAQCDRDDEAIQEAWDQAKGFVDAIIEAETKRWQM